jgi:hypothetical protein
MDWQRGVQGGKVNRVQEIIAVVVPWIVAAPAKVSEGALSATVNAWGRVLAGGSVKWWPGNVVGPVHGGELVELGSSVSVC